MKTQTKLALATLAAFACMPIAAEARGYNPDNQINFGNRAPINRDGMEDGTYRNMAARMNDHSNMPSYSVVWDEEDAYWRENYMSRPYVVKKREYTYYEPAYRYGVDLYNRYPNSRYEDLDQARIEREWIEYRGDSRLTWKQARVASRDAYNRAYQNNRAINPVDAMPAAGTGARGGSVTNR